MNVLIVNGNFLPWSPDGAAYMAGAALQAGHDVEVFDCYMADNLDQELQEKLNAFGPDVVGVSITTVTGDLRDEQAEFGTRYVDNRPKIKSVVETTRKNSNARIVLGGPGFNYYAEAWLDYLGLDCGIRGEGEFAFPLMLKTLEQGGDLSQIPGSIVRRESVFQKAERDRVRDFDHTALPAYDLFDTEKYNGQRMPFALFTKRGCAFGCTFCPHSSLEGSRYRLKSPQRVVDEIEHVLKTTNSGSVNFCDNSFNCPQRHAEAICREILDRGLEVKWTSGAVKPLSVTKDFCRLMRESGCYHVGLSIESASEKILKTMNRGYGVGDIREALDNLSYAGIPTALFLLAGMPGETPETIAETLAVVDDYPQVRSVGINIGIYLWTPHQKILETARQAGQFKNDSELFDGAYYISPELPKDYMIDFIASVKARKSFYVQVNKPYADYPKQVNSLS